MKFEFWITCDNAAFGETAADAEQEVARLLADLAGRVARGDIRNNIGRTQYHTLRDVNGNDVGRASFVYDASEERRDG